MKKGENQIINRGITPEEEKNDSGNRAGFCGN
jgi:hypothetical protein